MERETHDNTMRDYMFPLRLGFSELIVTTCIMSMVYSMQHSGKTAVGVLTSHFSLTPTFLFFLVS